MNEPSSSGAQVVARRATFPPRTPGGAERESTLMVTRSGCADCCAIDELLGGLSLRAVADAQRLASAADGAAQEVVLRMDQLVGHP